MSAAAEAHSLYEYQPSFILGFHGCDEAVGEKVLSKAGEHLKASEKEFDWLGHGIYFWEGSIARAWEWAKQRQAEGKINTPFVLGAVIDLGHCLDLFDRAAADQVRLAHGALAAAMSSIEKDMPRNVGKTPDKAGRALDCAVLNMLHTLRQQGGHPAFDSVRGPFLEGEPIYEGAGFRSHTHIQICVRSPACIKGYFRPIAAT